MASKNYLIVGGGVIGVSIARSLIRSSVPASSIRILEKEDSLGQHTSGRNSGVLHAGFYYATDSQKAKYCRVGNQEWTEFCDENQVPIKKCGKIVVCKSARDVEQF